MTGALLVILAGCLVCLVLLDAEHFRGIDRATDAGMGRVVTRLYYMTTTVTTVGFGDIVPVSMVARMLTMVLYGVIVAHVATAMRAREGAKERGE